MAYIEIHNEIEYRFSKDMVENHCLLHESQIVFLCTPRSDKEITVHQYMIQKDFR